MALPCETVVLPLRFAPKLEMLAFESEGPIGDRAYGSGLEASSGHLARDGAELYRSISADHYRSRSFALILLAEQRHKISTY